MTVPSYDAFFQSIAGNTPLPYQRRLVEGPWPDCLIVPTGLGKTAAILGAWLYLRLQGDPDTPQRLIYCLPMRVLVEQTERNARAWADTCRAQFGFAPSVYVLMGGAVDDQWADHPDHPAIIVGTQDMLLSRALMRGYGMSRYRWPIDFALLHNDALWVFDEIQLMGVGLATSSQLEAFRRMKELRPLLPSRNLWMSATLDPEWLGTVDFRRCLSTLRIEQLGDEDDGHEIVEQRAHACKMLTRANASGASEAYEVLLAEEVLKAHRPGKTTLVIVNRVDRAQEIYRCLRTKLAEGGPQLLLIHSRFRASERSEKEAQLPEPHEHRDLIIVATQAIEAGVDLSSAVMFTELAPWASLVQRFGRCNRYGELNGKGGGRLFWIDLGDEVDPKDALPYRPEELAPARARLAGLASARPADLPPVEGGLAPGQVIRRKDLIELFNTDPDLSGFDVDISPFIRDAEDVDVRVFWRQFERDPAPDAMRPGRDELCPVSLGRMREFLRRLEQRQLAFVWDPLGATRGRGRGGRWVRLDPDRLYPGLEIMLAADAGGYDPELGFTGQPGRPVEPVAPVAEDPSPDSARLPEGNDDDHLSWLQDYVPLSQHTSDVVRELERILDRLKPLKAREALLSAATWHDVGKAHPVFQETMRRDPPEAWPLPEGLLAKRPGRARHSRRGFRHELASVLVWLAHGVGPDKDLIAYLIAAHHGRVRMGLRALPIEREPELPVDGDGQLRRFARGIWDGDTLPELALADGTIVPATELQLDIMELGGGASGEESWAARTQRLLAEHGPFRLALLESLVRLADWRASEREREAEQ